MAETLRGRVLDLVVRYPGLTARDYATVLNTWLSVHFEDVYRVPRGGHWSVESVSVTLHALVETGHLRRARRPCHPANRRIPWHYYPSASSRR